MLTAVLYTLEWQAVDDEGGKVHTYIFNINNNRENIPSDILDNKKITIGSLILNDIDYCKWKLKTFGTDSRQKCSVHCCIVEEWVQ